MSYNGSGTFNINTSGQPVVTGTVISSTAFNALTADLATGLSTAITKDGQTAATARIPFAQGISSTLVTDSTSTTTGSIITAGGAGVAKALFVGTTANVAGAVTLQSTLAVGGVATYSAQPIFSSLTASSAVATDASKGLVSVTNTGTGNNVLATSPTLVTPALGTPSALVLTNATGLPQAGLAANVTGNGPAFSAYASAQSSAITTAVDTKVLFDTEIFDTNSNFASSRFTPTVAGYYQINATVRFNGTFTAGGLILFKNGTGLGYLENGTGNFVTGSSLQYMDGSTDYLEIYVNMTGTSLTVSNNNINTSYFNGVLVRAA
jgi:hypothetical protein